MIVRIWIIFILAVLASWLVAKAFKAKINILQLIGIWLVIVLGATLLLYGISWFAEQYL